MSRRKRWGILIGAVLAALALAGVLVIRSARFQVWSTLRRVRESEHVTAPERWLRDWGVVRQLEEREAAAQLAPLGKGAVAPLARALDDEDSNVRAAATLALCDMSRPAIPALIKALKNKDPFVRYRVPPALGEFGPAAKDAVPALCRVLDDRTEHTIMRLTAALALGMIGPAAKDAVPALVRALSDPIIPELHATAARALGEIGPAAKEAVPALKKLAQSDSDERVREAAAEALWKIQLGQYER